MKLVTSLSWDVTAATTRLCSPAWQQIFGTLSSSLAAINMSISLQLRIVHQIILQQRHQRNITHTLNSRASHRILRHAARERQTAPDAAGRTCGGDLVGMRGIWSYKCKGCYLKMLLTSCEAAERKQSGGQSGGGLTFLLQAVRTAETAAVCCCAGKLKSTQSKTL